MTDTEVPEDIVAAASAVAASCEDDFYFNDIRVAAERAILAERQSHADALAAKQAELNRLCGIAALPITINENARPFVAVIVGVILGCIVISAWISL